MVAVAVDTLVHRTHRPFELHPAQERHREAQHAPHAPREEDDARDHRQHDEQRLDPEVGAHVVAADREQEADGGEQERHRTSERPLEQHRAGDRRALAGVAAGRLVDPRGVSPDARRQHLADGVGDEVGAKQPPERLRDPAHA